MSGWLDGARGLPVTELAPRLGLAIVRGRTLACPACGAEKRSTSTPDRRGPVGLTRNGAGWHCHRCAAGGDAVDLAAYKLEGARFRELAGEARSRIRQFMEAGSFVAAEPRPALAPEPPCYPDADEVREFWASCVGVSGEPDVCAWLRSRHLSPTVVEERDLARAAPLGPLGRTREPRWARFRGEAWSEAGYRLVLPLRDASGTVRSLRARSVVTGASPKGCAPTGHEIRGTVLADDSARHLLTEGTYAGSAVAVICEGEPDYLTWTSRFSDADEDAPAVFGVVAGAWTAELAARIPDGSSVSVCTHDDPAGRIYARQIRDSLPNCAVFYGETEDI